MNSLEQIIGRTAAAIDLASHLRLAVNNTLASLPARNNAQKGENELLAALTEAYAIVRRLEDAHSWLVIANANNQNGRQST